MRRLAQLAAGGALALGLTLAGVGPASAATPDHEEPTQLCHDASAHLAAYEHDGNLDHLVEAHRLMREADAWRAFNEGYDCG